MISDLDIYRTTGSVPIREHGDEADQVAAQRDDEFLHRGDMEGSAVRRGVLKAIMETWREEPLEGKTVN